MSPRKRLVPRPRKAGIGSPCELRRLGEIGACPGRESATGKPDRATGEILLQTEQRVFVVDVIPFREDYRVEADLGKRLSSARAQVSAKTDGVPQLTLSNRCACGRFSPIR